MEDIIVTIIYVGVLSSVFLLASLIGILSERVPVIDRMLEYIIDLTKYDR